MAMLIAEKDYDGVVGAAAKAILRGDTLREWWNSFPPVELIDLPGSVPGARMQYFFSTLPLDDKEATIMGCVQRSDFPRRAAPDLAPTTLAEWLGANFLREARWTNDDGTPGGFDYRPVLIMDDDPKTAPVRVDEDFDLRIDEVGTRYGWAVCRLDLKDYIKAFPPPMNRYSRQLQAMNREAGYLMFHPDYFSSPYPRPEGCLDEYCFGYSVLPWQVLPSIAAYGAGRFYSAYKEYRFFLMNDGSVSVDVLFLVAPRCERVFNLFGFDPYFGGARLLNALTFGRTRVLERAHFTINHYAMGHHGRVHHNLLTGMRRIWEETNWQPARQAANKSSSGR